MHKKFQLESLKGKRDHIWKVRLYGQIISKGCTDNVDNITWVLLAWQELTHTGKNFSINKNVCYVPTIGAY